MSDDVAPDTALINGDAPKPRTMRFRRSNAPKLDSVQADRQGMIARLAFELLGGRDAAMAFLNEIDGKLGGRPLDIAMASDDGFKSIEDAMRNRSKETKT